MNPKPYNGGTWTQSRMMSFIRSNLRLATRKWGPMRQAKDLNRRTYRGANARQKWEYKCGDCGKWFKGTEVAVHHRIPCGSLKDWDDLGDFARRMFCEVDGLKLVCDGCHKAEHEKEKE